MYPIISHRGTRSVKNVCINQELIYGLNNQKLTDVGEKDDDISYWGLSFLVFLTFSLSLEPSGVTNKLVQDKKVPANEEQINNHLIDILVNENNEEVVSLVAFIH